MEKKDSVATFPFMKVSKYEFNTDKQVKYQSSTVTEKTETDKEIVTRNVSENECFYRLSKILRIKSVSLEM